jgi:glycine cleavage system H protein
MNPTDLLYSEGHQWVRVTDDTARLGMTEFKVNQLGDLVYVELPEAGDKLEEDEIYGEVGSEEMAEDLVIPIAGVVTEVNSQLVDDPSIAADDPYEEGWLIEVKIADTSQLDRLMTEAEYEEFILSAEEDEDKLAEELGFEADEEDQ